MTPVSTALLCLMLPFAARPVEAQQPMVKLSVKLMKAAKAPGELRWTVKLPADCPECSLIEDGSFNGQNAKEIFFGINVPPKKPLGNVIVSVPPADIRSVIFGGHTIPWRPVAGGITFDLPGVLEDNVGAVDLQTNVGRPGMLIRIEHGDPVRRAGYYAVGPFPEIQLRAAHNLEFAQWEAAQELKLDEYVDQHKLGHIAIEGFDTNNPHGHGDAPPHMHMFLWWGAGSRVAHYQIDYRGLLTSSVYGSEYREGGPPFVVVDSQGRPVYTHTVTADGFLTIESKVGESDGHKCNIFPVSSTFDTGAKVECDGISAKEVHVADDLDKGLIYVSVDGHTTEYRYDPDTGVLIGEKPEN